MPLVSCRRRRTHEQLTVTAVGFPVWHFFLNPSRASPAGVASLPLAQNLCAALWTFSGAGPSTIMHEAPSFQVITYTVSTELSAPLIRNGQSVEANWAAASCRGLQRIKSRFFDLYSDIFLPPSVLFERNDGHATMSTRKLCLHGRTQRRQTSLYFRLPSASRKNDHSSFHF